MIPKNIIKKGVLLSLIILIVIGVLARSVEVISGNFLWGFDHGREYLMTQEIVDDKNFRLIGAPLGGGSAGINGIFHGPGYFYFLAIPFIIFNGDPYGGIVMMYSFGIGTVLLSFWLAKRLFGNNFALLLTALISLSPPLISQSRAIWSPFPSTFFIVLSFIFVYLLTNKKKGKLKFVLFASFFSAFIYNFELAIAVPMVISLFLYLAFLFKRNLKPYFVASAGLILALSPMILFEIRHKFMAINGFISYITSPIKPNGPTFIENAVDHWGSFLFVFSNSIPAQGLLPGLILLTVFAAMWIFVLRSEKDANLKNFIFYLTSLPFVSFTVFLLLKNTVYEYYLYHLTVVYIFVFVYIISRFKKLNMRFVFYTLVLFITACFVVTVPKYLSMIRYDLYDYGGDAKIKGKKDALDFIYSDAKGEPFNLLIFTPPVYTYPYDYLISWYAEKKYGYKPGNEKEGVFYLLIQVDSYKPWSYEGWLETVIKSGEVIFEKKLPSGFIVQKRISNE